LWQSKPDGSQRQQLTSGPLRVFMMRWSPDARHIAFMGRLPGKPWKIYVIPADGGIPEMLTADNLNEADPAWSADGQSIVFGRPSLAMANDLVSDVIRIIDLKTRTASTIPGSQGLFCPRWSPDGRYIAAMPLHQRALVLYDMAAKTWAETAFDWVDNPLWSRDAKSIYFRGARKGRLGIYQMSLASRRIELTTDFRSLPPSEAVSYSGLSPQNAPIVSLRFVTADVFSVDRDPVR
jgi:Tol biopolymer transport system component